MPHLIPRGASGDPDALHFPSSDSWTETPLTVGHMEYEAELSNWTQKSLRKRASRYVEVGGARIPTNPTHPHAPWGRPVQACNAPLRPLNALLRRAELASSSICSWARVPYTRWRCDKIICFDSTCLQESPSAARFGDHFAPAADLFGSNRCTSHPLMRSFSIVPSPCAPTNPPPHRRSNVAQAYCVPKHTRGASTPEPSGVRTCVPQRQLNYCVSQP